MYTLILTVLSLLGALVASYTAAKVQVEYYQLHSRIDTVEEKITSALGKIGREKSLSRDQIRETVDNYLASLDIEQSGGMDGDLMQMMMMQFMQPGQSPEHDESGEVQSDNHLPYLHGKGGRNDGT